MSHQPSHRPLPLADQETLTLTREQLGRTRPHHLITPEQLARCGGDVWQARALALAEKAHLTGTVTEKQWVNAHPLTATSLFGSQRRVEIFHIPSTTEPWRTYTVAYDASTDRYHCECESGLHGRWCKHAGAVIYFVLTVHESFAQQARQNELGWQEWWDRQSPDWKAR